MKTFKIYHWEFIDEGDHINVYEQREGDIIGGLYPQECSVPLIDLEEFFRENKMTEQEVYDWLTDNIEYY